MTKKTRPEVIYWDSCIFIAWMKGEKRKNNEMDGVFAIITRIDSGDALLITSYITAKDEIKMTKHTPEAMQQLRGLLRRDNVEEIGLDPWIERRAKKIVEFYETKHLKDSGGELTGRDAIHLATAIEKSVDAFHTFDGGGKKHVARGKKRESRSLLSLDGDVAGYPLRICHPPVYELTFLVDADEGGEGDAEGEE